MLKLYGFDVSNYYNMLKLAMASKGLEYEVEVIYPNQTPDYLKRSHMGKVPALETEHGMLTETNIIMEYLDAAYPDRPLYSGDAFQQAKIKELVKLCELYLELPARRCHPEVFFGGKVSDEIKKDVKRALFKGIEGLARLAKFSPYLAGDEFTAADIMFLYSADLAAGVAHKLFDVDLLALAPGAKELMLSLNEREDVKQIAADRKEANIAFKKYVASLQN
ncbi:MAG: glutathione S-transferase [Paraglaciecola sp.]|jgi:glutathione S-transferase